MRATFLAVLTVVVLVACESKSPGPPVIVYAAYPEGPYLAEYFLDFTEQSGTQVTVIFGESSRHVDMILDNRRHQLTRRMSALPVGGMRMPDYSRNVPAIIGACYW